MNRRAVTPRCAGGTARTAPEPGASGFSLVELVIVVAVVAVLMSLAVPSYGRFTQRAHRVEAIARLLLAAQCQERTRAAVGVYDAARCLPAPLPRYAFAWQPGFSTSTWAVRAEPLAAQAGDDCGILVLAHTGERTAGADPLRCWSGR